MRRPDGTGGPLSADERIDDIQFYIDPRADLLIDDVILYEAAAPDEKRPFPKRIVFTAWFDTGKQGKEWPGEFEIVNHEKPPHVKAAKSVKAAERRAESSASGCAASSQARREHRTELQVQHRQRERRDY